MNYTYIPKGVCSKKMSFLIENNIIKDIEVLGGCPGNSLGIKSLIMGKNIDEVITSLKGIKCGFKNTSCPDQIATALERFKEEHEHRNN